MAAAEIHATGPSLNARSGLQPFKLEVASCRNFIDLNFLLLNIAKNCLGPCLRNESSTKTSPAGGKRKGTEMRQ